MKNTVGIDIGGTSIKGAVFAKGEVVKVHAVPTRGREGREAILGQAFQLLDALVDSDTERIGVASAGNIDPESGVCVYATDNLTGWTGTDIRGAVEARYKIPCRVENDAICALLGELQFYPEAKNVTLLTLGTGVGGASLAEGKILRGSNFNAARWGHVCLVPDGEACNCGKRGCAEQYLSATALLRNGRKKLPELGSCKELFELYEAGNAAARAVIEEFGFYLRTLAETVCAALSPERLILGGGVARSQKIIGRFLDGLDTEIAFAKTGELAGTHGARLCAEGRY